MRVAVLSDIHGNYWALSSVLEDISRRKPDLIINLGDSLYGPLKPNETYQLIRSCNILSVSGNQDRAILENLTDRTKHFTMNYVVNSLCNDAIEWLRALPQVLELDGDICAFHGTPNSDKTYLLEDLKDGYRQVNAESIVETYLAGVKASVILCGHSHTCRQVQTSKRLIINPGSVGLQAYDDELPIYHKMESHNNMAQYCMLDIANGVQQVAQISVKYPFEKAVSCAKSNNRLDWAKWLEFGHV